MLYSTYVRLLLEKESIPAIGWCHNCSAPVLFFSGWDLESDGRQSRLVCGETCKKSLSRRVVRGLEII